MFWADRVAKEVIALGKYKPYWVDDMKTPSGRVHVGALRGVVVHDLLYRALLDQGIAATFTYVFEDHDPMDEISHHLDRGKWSKYLGQPLFTIPSPDGSASNFARYFALEFQQVFEGIGSHPKIIWVSDLYKAGRMNDGVRLCLDKADIIRKIYEELYKKKIAKDWYPFQIVCPKCGKESTTKVINWDGENVDFTCAIDAVPWTKGCGTSGKTSPFSSKDRYAGKLPWKVEWAVKWMVIGVTVEGAGKDHMSAGGSHDVARLVCERVLDYPTPYPIAYEFFLIGGKKMSSSKGLGSSAKEVSQIIPPYLLRFLMVRTQINQAINFDPGGFIVPDLFDEYDRCWKAYISNSDADLARIFELSQTTKHLEGGRQTQSVRHDSFKVKESVNGLFLPRFRDVANYMQLPNIDVQQKFAELKGSKLTDEEKNILDERINYAKIWIEKYAPGEYRIQITQNIPKEVASLSQEQKDYLVALIPLLEQRYKPEELQLEMYNLTKTKKINPQKAFAAIYISLLGKTHGPKAAWFLLSQDINFIKKRFKEVSNL